MRSRYVLSLCLAAFAGVNAFAQIQPADSDIAPLSATERVKYFGTTTFGPAAMATGLVTAGIGTWRDAPHEWGPHWDGFGKRYGSGLGRRVVSRGVEVGLGAMWGEDPRYHRLGEGSMKARLGNVTKMIVLSYDESGNTMPAYARYVGVTTSSLVARTWLPDSQRGTGDFVNRIAMGFVARAIGNSTREFLPDLKKKMRKAKSSDELLTQPVR